MAVAALSSALIARPGERRSNAAKTIDARRNGFQMVRVDTAAIAAEVIHHIALRNVPHEEEVRPTVGIALEVAAHMKCTVPVSVLCSLPLPASCVEAFDLGEKAWDRVREWTPTLGLAQRLFARFGNGGLVGGHSQALVLR